MADIHAQITRVRDAANDIADTATEKLKDTRESAGEAYSDVKDRTHRIAGRANEIIQEHPIVAVAGAVAAGAVIAWLFPKSRAAMKALPGLAATAGTKFVEAAIAARAAATDGAETLKASAGDALHSARESASEAVAAARETANSADLAGKASKLADDIVALVTEKAESVSEAVKARLPKR